VTLRRTDILLKPQCSRVLLRPFEPPTIERLRRILDRILSVPEREAQSLLDEIIVQFDVRHPRLRAFLLRRFAEIQAHIGELDGSVTETRRLLIGAYFTQEYALESAALFNPSIVWHPDQSNLESGERRFILSLRATGEGHISSICFQTGTLGARGSIHMDTPSEQVAAGEVVPDASFDRHLFTRKLREVGISSGIVDEVCGRMNEEFTLRELEERLEAVSLNLQSDIARARAFVRSREHFLSLAQSNYEVRFSPDSPLSERVLFPTAPSERNGIEDARFVRFVDEDSIRYYATYTAYNGSTTVPQLIETEDFVRFKMSTLNGPEVRNKGMALFPRKIGGRYAMLSRQDNENIFLMFSEHLHFWSNRQQILSPAEPWEYVQIGNCGSPIETERGWLVLSHGVGPMRRYSISAFLLDLDDPSRVIGRRREPLLVAEGGEREGYVPNVVYSCGAVASGDRLILPYAVSDYASSFAVVDLPDLLSSMQA
jgi:predicted GH43/DUF377 family glycosyl hydrolase